METIAREVYAPGLRAKAAALASGSLPKAEGSFRQELAAMTSDGDLPDPAKDMESTSNGYDGGSYITELVDAVLAPEREALKEAERAQMEREVKEWEIPETQARLHQNFTKNRAKLVRSSELPSPAPNGHFVREFGRIRPRTGGQCQRSSVDLPGTRPAQRRPPRRPGQPVVTAFPRRQRNQA